MQARLRIGTAPARAVVFKSLGCNKFVMHFVWPLGNCTPFPGWLTGLNKTIHPKDNMRIHTRTQHQTLTVAGTNTVTASHL